MSFGKHTHRKVSEYSLQHLKLFIFFSPRSTAGNSNTCIEMLKVRKFHPSGLWQDCPQPVCLVGEVSILFLYGICNTHIHVHMSRSTEQVTNQAHKIRYVPSVVHNITKIIFFSVQKSFYLKFCGLQSALKSELTFQVCLPTHSVKQK